MKKGRKLIYIIITILILIILILAVLIKEMKVEEEFYSQHIELEETPLVNTLQIVERRNDYYAAKNCVDKFYLYYMTLFNVQEYYYQETDVEKLKNIEIQNANVLYNMLDKEYIEKEQVTVENIKTKLNEIKISNVNITSMYMFQKNYDMEVYVVKGILSEKETKNTTQFEVIVKVDLVNKTFSVLPTDYVKENYNIIEIGSIVDINVSERINENKNNTYKYNTIDDETYLKDMLQKLSNELNYSIELVYDNLDSEYRNKKFGKIEEFKKYIEKHNDDYSAIQIEKYQKVIGDNYIRYICIDKKENYYILKENGVMDYELILDTYTIDLPEFTEKYNSASNSAKVGYNIQKCIDAINDGDYTYVYNKLDNTFKQNNYNSQEEFVNYIKNNLFAINEIDSNVSTSNQNDLIYTYNIIIKNTEKPEEKKNMTVIMQLKENTDFTMSFSIQ